MKIIRFIIIIILIIILINVIYSKYIIQEPLIKLFGKSFLIVSTGSMEPTIMTEELIIITEKEKYEEGDIVTYIDEDGFIITHRILEINADTFVTKGDANNIKDDECDINCIQGKVIFHSKLLGFFVIYLLKPIICIYAFTIILFDIVRLYILQKQKNVFATTEDKLHKNQQKNIAIVEKN